jgi:hypothetical protein
MALMVSLAVMVLGGTAGVAAASRPLAGATPTPSVTVTETATPTASPTVTVTGTATPKGGVSTGGGGTAKPDAMLLMSLGAASLLTVGGFVVARRRRVAND